MIGPCQCSKSSESYPLHHRGTASLAFLLKSPHRVRRVSLHRLISLLGYFQYRQGRSRACLPSLLQGSGQWLLLLWYFNVIILFIPPGLLLLAFGDGTSLVLLISTGKLFCREFCTVVYLSSSHCLQQKASEIGQLSLPPGGRALVSSPPLEGDLDVEYDRVMWCYLQGWGIKRLLFCLGFSLLGKLTLERKPAASPGSCPMNYELA